MVLESDGAWLVPVQKKPYLGNGQSLENISGY